MYRVKLNEHVNPHRSLSCPTSVDVVLPLSASLMPIAPRRLLWGVVDYLIRLSQRRPPNPRISPLLFRSTNSVTTLTTAAQNQVNRAQQISKCPIAAADRCGTRRRIAGESAPRSNFSRPKLWWDTEANRGNPLHRSIQNGQPQSRGAPGRRDPASYRRGAGGQQR